MSSEEVMWTRFSDLVGQLREEEGGAVRGWQSRVARRLGMDRSYFAKLLSGERMIGWAAAARVASALGMRPAYFADDRHSVPWREYRDRAESPDHDCKPCAAWALSIYRECQRDAEGDPWFEPGGAERRFIARLREYAGDRP